MSMTKRDFEMMTEQMQSILDGAPDSTATHYVDDTDTYFSMDFGSYWHHQLEDWDDSDYRTEQELQDAYESVIKLSDIRAELSSRQQLVDETVNDELAEQAGLDILYEHDSEKTCWIDDTEIAHAMSSHVDDYSHDELKQIAMAASVVINTLREQSAIEPTHMKCALLRDSSLEKLQWLINENLANGWNLVGAVVSAGIHNDTFMATMMKVAGDE